MLSCREEYGLVDLRGAPSPDALQQAVPASELPTAERGVVAVEVALRERHDTEPERELEQIVGRFA